MSFKESISLGYVKVITPNLNRSNSLYISSKDALISALEIQIKEHNLKTILRELYESLREMCESVAYKKGFKFSSHEAITYFLKDYLKENMISIKFDKYRKIRNEINYYGRPINIETIIKAKIEIPLLIKKLEKHLYNE